jgi:hypothetical protein
MKVINELIAYERRLCERVRRAKCAFHARTTRTFWGITKILCMSVMRIFCKG